MVPAVQALPQAPQLSISVLTSAQRPLQQAPHSLPAGQQTWLPQEPQRRLVSLLHALQAARHAFCCALLRHWQKALHGSCAGLPAAQAVPAARGLSTAPANTAPRRRNDSRRGTDSASDFENSSNRWSMMGSFLGLEFRLQLGAFDARGG